ncbi:MAG: apolipoprotein N-acyltransferase [Candidatus Aquicultor sp.]
MQRLVENLKRFPKNTLIDFLLAIVSGLLLALAFPYPSIGSLAWIGLIPLLFALQRTNAKGAALLGFAFGLSFFFIVLYWIQVFGFIALIALSSMLSLWMVLFALGARLVMRTYKGTAQFVILPALWALCELGRALGPWGFAWANLGSTADNPYLLQLASYIGEYGLGFVFVMINLIGLRAIEAVVAQVERRDREWVVARVRLAALGITTLIASVMIWPAASAIVVDAAGPGETGMHASQSLKAPSAIKVAIIQANIPQNLKADVGNDDAIKARYLTMTKEALKSKPDLIIWPESALVSYISNEREFVEKLNKLLVPRNTSLIFGCFEDDAGLIHNDAFYFDRYGRRQAYRKIHLVPFGEYIPMRALVERINNLATLVRNITPGTDYKVFEFPGQIQRGQEGYARTDAAIHSIGRFSTIICFESCDSPLVAKMVNAGAQALVVITNDGWFGKTAALEQHFRITRMRAAEYGVPVIQTANTGISGIIDGNGRITAKSGVEQQRILLGTIEFSPGVSFFTRYGHLMPYLYLAIILAAALYRRALKLS